MPMRMPHPNRVDAWFIPFFFEYTNIINSIHPMNLLPAFAPTSNFNIADLFTNPLPRHRFDTLIGDTATPLSSTPVAPTVDSAPVGSTVVASASVPTATSVSDSVQAATTTPPIVLDTGASYSRAPSASDFLPVGHASYGLIRSPISVVSKALASKAFASTPVDPYTLITGEDAIDLSSSDLSNSGSVETASSFVKVHFDIRAFGTATLTFVYSKSSSELLHIFVDPNQIDWLHWIPLPRLTPTESYFHICGRDYLQAFALLHLIPIWITLVSALVSALLRSE